MKTLMGVKINGTVVIQICYQPQTEEGDQKEKFFLKTCKKYNLIPLDLDKLIDSALKDMVGSEREKN
jgi:hypothetical protein